MARCSRRPSDNWESIRFSNKNSSSNERALYMSYWEELINIYGVRVEYYTYNYSLTTHDALYGEEPTANFSGPTNVNLMIELPNEAIMLSKFGYDTNADFNAVISINDFQKRFGVNSEPKAGDVIRLIEAGWSTNEVPPTTADVLAHLCANTTPACAATFTYTVSDLEWIRCPQLYEITERVHQDFSMNRNTLLGHYVWVIRGKRFDYSYQPGIKPECKQEPVGEETFVGILTGGSQDASDPKVYDQNIEDESNKIWDYNKGSEARSDDVYGEY